MYQKKCLSWQNLTQTLSIKEFKSEIRELLLESLSNDFWDVFQDINSCLILSNYLMLPYFGDFSFRRLSRLDWVKDLVRYNFLIWLRIPVTNWRNFVEFAWKKIAWTFPVIKPCVQRTKFGFEFKAIFNLLTLFCMVQPIVAKSIQLTELVEHCAYYEIDGLNIWVSVFVAARNVKWRMIVTSLRGCFHLKFSWHLRYLNISNKFPRISCFGDYKQTYERHQVSYFQLYPFLNISKCSYYLILTQM